MEGVYAHLLFAILWVTALENATHELWSQIDSIFCHGLVSCLGEILTVPECHVECDVSIFLMKVINQGGSSKCGRG